MPNYNYFGGRTPLISDEPAELQYTFGFPQVPELKNQWDVYRVQAQINSNQNQRQAADQELMHASELAKNHPATNAGIFLGNILGTAGAYALANSLPKWFAKKSTSQVNSMSPEARERVAEKITGMTIPQMTSQAMNGYTPPTQNNFNLPDWRDWRKTQTWQPTNLNEKVGQNLYPAYNNAFSNTPGWGWNNLSKLGG